MKREGKRENLRLRAIYTQDVRFDSCPVFELNTETNYFEMLEDRLFRYKSEEIYEDENFLVFAVYKEREEDEVETVEYLKE